MKPRLEIVFLFLILRPLFLFCGLWLKTCKLYRFLIFKLLLRCLCMFSLFISQLGLFLLSRLDQLEIILTFCSLNFLRAFTWRVLVRLHIAPKSWPPLVDQKRNFLKSRKYKKPLFDNKPENNNDDDLESLPPSALRRGPDWSGKYGLPVSN